jgi:hypothetical protein
MTASALFRVTVRPSLDTGGGSIYVAKFDFEAKSQNLVSGIQWLADTNTLEKATLRQESVKI